MTPRLRSCSWLLLLGACASEPSPAAPAESRAETGSEQPRTGEASATVADADATDAHDIEWGHPVDENLRAGGQPSAAELGVAAAAGYTTVISLRKEGEPDHDERTTVAGLGMEFVRIPVDGASGLTLDNARALDAALDAAEGRVMLHCGSGNRAGALLGLRAYVTEGVTGDEALAMARGAGMTELEPALEAKLRELCTQEPERCPGEHTEIPDHHVEPEGPPVE